MHAYNSQSQNISPDSGIPVCMLHFYFLNSSGLPPILPLFTACMTFNLMIITGNNLNLTELIKTIHFNMGGLKKKKQPFLVPDILCTPLLQAKLSVH